MTWPAVRYKQQTWRGPAVWDSRSLAVGNTSGAYHSAIPPAIANVNPQIPEHLSLLVEKATLELIRFDAEYGQRLQDFGPLLLRSEAAASSRIENLTASARQVLAAELNLSQSRNAQDIAGNTRAMQAALDLAGSPNSQAILAMHRALLPESSTGTWRTETVWIGTSSLTPVNAEYVAPEPELVPGLMADLDAFMARTELAPLTLAALAHAQFETIHPFTDGNGRTGRALVQSLLRHRGVTRSVAIPVSAGLLTNVAHYHGALNSYRAGDVEPILQAFTHAALRAVSNSRHLVEDLNAIHTQWIARLTQAKIRSDSLVWGLLDELLMTPVATAADLADQLGVAGPNVYPHLNRLEKLGIAEKKNAYRKGSYWIASEPLAALDAFAERAGRRD